MAGLISIFNRYSIVKQLPVFSKLNWLELQKIARKSSIAEYKKGEVIRKQGDPPDALYCLVSGRVQAYTVKQHHFRQNVDFIHRGMHFGIVSLLTGEPHSLNYEAINDSLILKIEKKDFEQILADIPRLGIEFSQSLSRRVRISNEKIKSVFESKIVSVYSPVIGTGSSTYAVNLALSLANESKKKVIYVNITSMSRRKTDQGSEVGEATPHWKKEAVKLNEIMDDYAKVRQSIASGDLPIDVLNVNFDARDTILVNRISIFVTELAHDYPYVVVDLPSEMDEVVLHTLMQSDIVQLITLDKKEDLHQTRQVIDRLEDLMKENFYTERVQIILSGSQPACYLSFEEVNRELDYDIYTKLPHIDRAQLNVAAVTENMSVITPHQDSEYAKTVTRISRTISGVRICLILGGGAALGVAHIGVIRVLERENIPIDMVVGISMGALVGAFWVTCRDAKGLEEIAQEFQSSKAMGKLFDPVFPKSGIVGGRLIKLWLKTRGLGNKTFYSTRIPLRIVAYDLMHRKELIIESGSLVDAVRKSIAIPGVIEPVIEKDQIIIDGGVLNPLPTNVPLSSGIKKIIAINVLQSPEHVNQGYLLEQERLKALRKLTFSHEPWKYLQFKLSRGIARILSPNIPDIIVRSLQASEYVIAEQSAQHADVLIHPDLTGIHWYELYKVDELIKSGEEAALKALPAIKELVKL